MAIDLSVILPVMNEGENLRVLLPRMRALLERERLAYEIIVVDGGSTDGTPAIAEGLGARPLRERRPGYAGALETGFAEARGNYLLTLDADMSHEPAFVTKMWRARARADIVIASRYTRGGAAYTGMGRNLLSRLLNFAMRSALALPVLDMSSGFRLYRREAIADLKLASRNFEVLEEILVKAYANGFSIYEVPFTYFPRDAGRSHARLIRFGLALTYAAASLWPLRNSFTAADYDERAFYSLIPLQRYWQRRRHRIVTFWARGASRTLDLGCGSSIIIQSLNNAIGMDLSVAKARFLNRRGVPIVRGSAFALPFRDASCDCVISSQVIEHVPEDRVLFTEMWRVLEPGGRLLIGTPDYATRAWRTIEPIYGLLKPGGYRDDHITHYTRASLSEILTRQGFVHEESTYILGAELVMRWRKPASAATAKITDSTITLTAAAPE
ncbi:MAG TPA: glycosyltransferase [Candidatus Binataceae bacterium]|nr:glycosyltransferase [Candidatus Binataceae bacterium]